MNRRSQAASHGYVLLGDSAYGSKVKLQEQEYFLHASILKFGSDGGKYYKREPWRWSYKTKQIVKYYLQLRTKLIPYLYAESYKYSKYGLPLIMPIFYRTPEFYDDERYRNEYYLGTELFVSPILHKKEIKFYFY